MTLTLLAVAAAVAMAALYAVSTKSDIHAVLAADQPVGESSMGGQNTIVGLGDPAAETLSGGSRTPVRTDWAMATLTDLSEAEDVLDWAENHGFAERELVVLGNSSFAVRWR